MNHSCPLQAHKQALQCFADAHGSPGDVLREGPGIRYKDSCKDEEEGPCKESHLLSPLSRLWSIHSAMDTWTHLISAIQNQQPQWVFLQLGDSMTRGQVSSSVSQEVKGGKRGRNVCPYLHHLINTYEKHLEKTLSTGNHPTERTHLYIFMSNKNTSPCFPVQRKKSF